VSLDQAFVRYTSNKLDQLASRIADCLGRLNYDQIWSRGSENENSVGNLVLHLCGNVRQWIVSGVGGAPDIRQRDAEFSARGGPEAAELSERLTGTVAEAKKVLAGLTLSRLEERRTIQNYDVTVLEAVMQVVEHFSHHTGQIIFATKLLLHEDLGYYAHLNKPKHSETTP
jgi:uncharacterized damage-inducible protein DinB